MTAPSPSLAERIRDVALDLEEVYALVEKAESLRAIASELDQKAEEMRRESGGAIPYMDEWADSLARRKG